MEDHPLDRDSLSRLAAALLIAAATVGCGKDKVVNCKDCGGWPQPLVYPALDTPQHTLQNLQISWTRRDSVRTKQIYADTYVGTSTDQVDHTALTFTKNQEVAVVGVMARRTEITSVAMTLQPESLWVRLTYPSDPATWTAIQLKGVNIQVDDTMYGTQVANASTFFEFKLEPTVDHTSPTDTTWQVVRWTEVRQ